MPIDLDLIKSQTTLIRNALLDHIEENPVFYAENSDSLNELEAACKSVSTAAAILPQFFEPLSQADGLFIKIATVEMLQNTNIVEWISQAAALISCVTGKFEGPYEVHTFFFSDEGENIWSCDGAPQTFPSIAIARNAINEHLHDVSEAFKAGYLDDEYESEIFKIYNNLTNTYVD